MIEQSESRIIHRVPTTITISCNLDERHNLTMESIRKESYIKYENEF